MNLYFPLCILNVCFSLYICVLIEGTTKMLCDHLNPSHQGVD